jgi:hypothetical protein
MIERLDAWVTALNFAAAILVFWSIGWWWGRRAPREPAEDPGIKFTDASMALLGLLLAFTCSMALGRHDQRRQAAVAESKCHRRLSYVRLLAQGAEPFEASL